MPHASCCMLHPLSRRSAIPCSHTEGSSSALCGPPAVPPVGVRSSERGGAEHAEGTLDLPSELPQDALAQINQLHTRSCVPTPVCGQDARARVWECSPATTGQRHRPTLSLCAHTTPESASRCRTHSARGSTCARRPARRRHRKSLSEARAALRRSSAGQSSRAVLSGDGGVRGSGKAVEPRDCILFALVPGWSWRMNAAACRVWLVWLRAYCVRGTKASLEGSGGADGERGSPA